MTRYKILIRLIFFICTLFVFQIGSEVTAQSSDNDDYTMRFELRNISGSDCSSYAPVVEFNAWLNGNSLGTFTLGYLYNDTTGIWYWVPQTQKYDITASLYSPGSINSNVLSVDTNTDMSIPIKTSWLSYWQGVEDNAEAKSQKNETVGFVYVQFYRNGVEMADARGFVIVLDELHVSPNTCTINDWGLSFKIN